MTPPIRKRSVPQAVHGSCRWLQPLQADNAGTLDGTRGCLEINGPGYLVTIHRDRGRLVGYQLCRLTDLSKCYDMDAERGTCDCPDATYRQRQCKHLLRLGRHRRAVRRAAPVAVVSGRRAAL
jgi:hypothetical protein